MHWNGKGWLNHSIILKEQDSDTCEIREAGGTSRSTSKGIPLELRTGEISREKLK